MGSRGPDCGTHCPSGVTSSRTSAFTVEFWRFPGRGGEEALVLGVLVGWEASQLGLRSRPEKLANPHPTQLTSAGGQAAGLDRVRLGPLTLPQTVGVGPAHHLPLLDALSAGDRTLSWRVGGGGLCLNIPRKLRNLGLEWTDSL